MKSVLQAAWLLTVAFGNVIVIIVAKAKAFDSQVITSFKMQIHIYNIISIQEYRIPTMYLFILQASEFFMFGIFMLLDMVLFSFLAYRYKYVKNDNKKSEDMQLEETNTGDRHRNSGE